MNIIETERLILRTWQDADLDPMARIDQDENVCRFLPAIGNKEATAAGIKRIVSHYNAHGFSLYAVELKATHEMIGFLGLMIPSFEAHFTPAVEIGWRLSSQHWNKGYATEGAKAVLHHAFIRLSLKEVVSFTAVSNQASRRVMEKIGLHRNPKDDFDHPKLEKDTPLRPHVLYRLSQTEYCQKTNDLIVVKALTQTEWDAVRHLRQFYFFDKAGLSDPYTWTFEHEAHVHFVLYQGATIIGYAHLQLWPNQRAAMRIIVIDAPKRNHQYGYQLLTWCEKWLRHQDYKCLHVDASPQALGFYRKNAYVDMPFDDPDGYPSDPQDTSLGKKFCIE